MDKIIQRCAIGLGMLVFLNLVSCANEATDQDSPALCGGTACESKCCGEACVDTNSNPLHCGACGVQCDTNEQCSGGKCVKQGCTLPLRMCSGQCVDLSSDPNNCDRCGKVCGDNMKCVGGQCYCESNFVNCDNDITNGCELSVNDCVCAPGSKLSCYDHDAATNGVGACKSGTKSCIEGGYYGWCEGQVGPVREILNNKIDDDCDGEVDEDGDDDGDGWTRKQGDCCDHYSDCTAQDPAAVNPGAYDFPGNQIDDDCDGTIDNPPTTTCSTSNFALAPKALLTDADALKLAQAMDICKQSDGKTWGLVSAKLTLANGDPMPTNVGTNTVSPAEQIAVSTLFGSKISPKFGKTMAIISSGKAKGKENTALDDKIGTEVKAPSEFLSAHNNRLPAPAECPPSSDPKDAGKLDKAFDSVKLSLKLKVPTNAKGFKFNFRFFSKEYPYFACGKFNDFFLALLNSKHADIPADHNISFDKNNNPVSVNNAFFTSCEQQSCVKSNFHEKLVTFQGSCPASLPCADDICGGKSSCPDGSADVTAYTTDPNKSGATAWLLTEAPVVGGEEITLDFIVFDAGGFIKDSLVLLDNFEWKIEPTQVRTVVN